MKIFLGILIVFAVLALLVFVFICKMAMVMYPFMHRKMYGPPLEYEESSSDNHATFAKSSDKAPNNTPSLFETAVDEARQER